MVKLRTLRNIGEEIEKKLESVDICSAEELIEIGSKDAFLRLKTAYSNCYLVHLYTLQGAIDGIEYNQLTEEIKFELKEYLEYIKH